VQKNSIPLSGASLQTKLAMGEIVLWILNLQLPADLAIARLRDAANDMLVNQYHNTLTHPVPGLKLVRSA